MNYCTGTLKEVKDKWEKALNDDLSYKIIENAFKNISTIKSGAYHRYFQFKLLHNRIITNKKLYKMKISDSMMCKICLTEVDSIKHAFLECSTTVTLWNQVEQWAKLKINNSLIITDIDKIFGHQMKNEIVDKIILITKIVIYQNRMKNKSHHLLNIKRLLFNESITEEYEANIYQTENRFQLVWGRLYNDLKETFLS